MTLPPRPSLPNPVPAEVTDTTRTGPPNVLDQTDTGPPTDQLDNRPDEVAALVAVTSMTWRYDTTTNTAQDLVQTLGRVAAPQLIEHITPDTSEQARRRMVGEVSWAIITHTTINPTNPAGPGTDLVAGAVDVVVDVERHLITTTTPETVTVLQITVTVEPTPHGWQATRLDDQPGLG